MLQLEKLIAKNYYLHQSARDGFRAYIQSYASYSLKTIFDVASLDLAKVGKAFGFPVPPSVNINIGSGMKGKKRKGKDGESGSESDDDSDDDAPRGNAGARRGGNGKAKRREVEGARKTEKDFYREGREKKAAGGIEGKQWSR